MCVYVYITLQREFNLFDLQWNVLRIRVLHLELPGGVPDPMVAFKKKFNYPSFTKAS